MVFELTLHRNRTSTHRITYKDANGDAITIAATDMPRLKVFAGNAATPDLELYTDANLYSSVMTIQTQSGATLGQVDVTFGQKDILHNLSIGVHDAEITLVDDSATAPANAILHAENGIVHVLPGPGGDVGLTKNS